MKNGWFTIKEVSDLFDNTRGAIRFYEEKGLIHPRRDEHDFRWYSIDDIFQLFYLKRYASMSFSLDETLTTFVKEAELTLPEIQTRINKREQELNVQIERLMQQREELRKYRRVLQECESPCTRIEVCPDYYVLTAEAFADMTAADLPALKALIAAMPLTSVHADLIEDLPAGGQSPVWGSSRTMPGPPEFRFIRKCGSCPVRWRQCGVSAVSGMRCRGS